MACPDGLEAMAAKARKAAGGIEQSGPWWALACMLEGVADQLCGRLAEAHRHLLDAEAAGRGSAAVHNLVLAQIALYYFAVQRWTEAATAARRAVVGVERAGLVSHPWMANVFAVAAVMLETGEPGERYGGQARELAIELGDVAPWLSGESLLMVAAAQIAAGEAETARGTLDLASDPLHRLSDATGLRSFNRALRIELYVRDGATDTEVPLTRTEAALLEQLSTGATLSEIAKARSVSRNTVKAQASSLYRKLDVQNRHDAIQRGRDLGLV